MTARVDNSILLKKKNLFLKTDDAENLKFSWQDWAVFLTQFVLIVTAGPHLP